MMAPISPRLIERVRAFTRSDWEENARVRWAAQIAAGALPGLLLVAIIMHTASQPNHPHGHGTNAASMVPLLSASAIADSAAFHRFDFNSATTAGNELEFRPPHADAPALNLKRVLTVTKRTSPLEVDFSAPRIAWQHLNTTSRRGIDAGIKSATAWKRVVLHGTASNRGALRLLDRYQTTIQGIAGGTPYHFVIGNGTDSGDGQVEISTRWQRGEASPVPALGDGSIQVCLIGDFEHQPPTKAQLEALDELLDYLALKLGGLPLATHGGMSGEHSRCLGAKFPMAQVLNSAR